MMKKSTVCINNSFFNEENTIWLSILKDREVISKLVLNSQRSK